MVSNFFRDSENKEESVQKITTAPGKEPTATNRGLKKYNPNLISTLILEHKYLLGVYSEILKTVDSAQYDLLAAMLLNFSSRLQEHLVKEHMELYVYLENIQANNPGTFKKMHNLRLEMDKIAGVVMSFLNDYQKRPVSKANAEKFKTDLEKIGKLLVGRIQLEETSLYTLYKPNI